ncbi:MAG TPA: MFS transporter [Ignavibacteriaceae bacterium]|nr:MFS transporter [Ignavibacteriaceae bacterium]
MAAKTGPGFVLRALRYRNYRLFFGGQAISLIGTWMQQIALGWLVYRLTDSAFLLGLVGFATQIPTFLIATFAGVIADKYDNHKIIITTQSLAMIQAFLLAYLTLTHQITIWHIISLCILIGIINAFDMPTRQRFVIEMVEDKNDLPNAIALNSSMFNSARLIGPTIAGFLISSVGEGMCFLLNAISYLAVIGALLAMKLKRKETIQKNGKVLRELKEGIKYAYNFKPIRAFLILIAVASFAGMPYTILMPVVARDILHGNANTLGFLMAAIGSGAVGGALYLASRRTVIGLGKWVFYASSIFGFSLILFSFSRTIPLSIFLLLFTGFGMMVQMASCNTLLQTIVDDDKRGRVMSLYITSFVGAAPFGSLIAGGLAGTIGTPGTILLSGLIIVFAAFIFRTILPAIRILVRPIYIDKGIIPEVSTGIQATTHLHMPPED